MIVEDDAEIAALLGDFLRREGFEVAIADGGVALDTQLAAGARPDLLVLDLMLPGEDGLSICRRLHASGGPPIIMLTAQGRGHRPRARARDRRRRLRDEAVQPARAAGAHPGRAAPRAFGAGIAQAAPDRFRVGDPHDRPRRAPGRRGGRRPRARAHQRRVRPAAMLRHTAAARFVARPACSTGRAGAPATPSTARSTSR